MLPALRARRTSSGGSRAAAAAVAAPSPQDACPFEALLVAADQARMADMPPLLECQICLTQKHPKPQPLDVQRQPGRLQLEQSRCQLQQQPGRPRTLRERQQELPWGQPPRKQLTGAEEQRQQQQQQQQQQEHGPPRQEQQQQVGSGVPALQRLSWPVERTPTDVALDTALGLLG